MLLGQTDGPGLAALAVAVAWLAAMRPRQRPVAASDRREQLAVLGGDGVRPLGGGEGGAGGHGDLVPEPVEDLRRDGIARQLGDAQMEPPVEVGRQFQVSGSGDLLEPPGLGFEVGQRRGRKPAR